MTPLHFASKTNIGGQTTSHKHKYDGNKYLTEDHARHIYKKGESSKYN